MKEKEHFERLNHYFEKSKTGYDLVLSGSKHFGFYPDDQNISEKEAQIFMQERVAEKLKLSSKDLVLDAGCGQGVVSTFLAKKYECKIEGITVLPFEIKKANLLAEKLKVSDKVSYSLMDYSKTKFRNNHFDCIYTTESLSHSLDISKTLKEFFRILKKGGRVAFFEYTVSKDEEFSSSEMKIFDKIVKSSAMSGLKDFRHDEFHNVLSEAGFTNVQVEDISQNAGPSLARLKKYAMLPYYVFVKPFGLQEKFPNASAAVEFYNMAEKGLIRYNIFTANK
ncbi:methyltransferase domain-containing protein [Psychroflexus sp. CAK57W]|uniref:methyltransferase domain-containing protein n=1 Tax=Psychroflexus curvus TaxID=2873595 RepID=UPI001CCD4B0E|nr:methyltransferase domain-containing protein [Psychroflexus curvus]MBZ9787725.1 methyltransferase domain-containing protein [Psychroflexus curvus]